MQHQRFQRTGIAAKRLFNQHALVRLTAGLFTERIIHAAPSFGLFSFPYVLIQHNPAGVTGTGKKIPSSPHVPPSPFDLFPGLNPGFSVHSEFIQLTVRFSGL
jgi:hypothetical protein